MGQLDFSQISKSEEKQLLLFLNQAYNAKDILQLSRYKTSVDDSKDYGIGPIVAARIITHKRSLPSRRFTDISELNGIQGFGQDKFDDIANFFKTSSAERFKSRLYQEGILYDNWELEYHTYTFEDDESFLQQTQDVDTLRQSLMRTLDKEIEEISEDAQAEVRHQLSTQYIEVYDITYLASYAWTLWFFHYDQDNWFSFEVMRSEIGPYLSFSEGLDIAFGLVKGFDNTLIWKGGIQVKDLPFVLNKEERSLNIWSALLFD